MSTSAWSPFALAWAVNMRHEKEQRGWILGLPYSEWAFYNLKKQFSVTGNSIVEPEEMDKC